MTDEAIRFEPGIFVATPAAHEFLISVGVDRYDLLNRHIRGDWGNLCEEDKASNEYAVNKYMRIFSSYHITPLQKVWVITEADRSVTTVLLPSDY